MVSLIRFKDYVEYFQRAHKIIYGKDGDDIYADTWAKEAWRRQELGASIDLPTLSELKKMDINEQIKALNEGVYGGRIY